MRYNWIITPAILESIFPLVVIQCGAAFTPIDSIRPNTTTNESKILKKKLINEKNFLLTYGDGIADVNIKKLYKFHSKNNSICTLTAVKPKSRFGVLKFRTNNKIFDFNEKPKNDFKNGGFMIFSNKIFKYIKNDKSILEKDVLPRLAKKNLLSGYKHLGFWECIDTMKDKIEVTKSIKMKKFIWLKK